MHKILALWAVPRSTSTAFEWMMRQRGDFLCHHEPFGEAWYYGEDRRCPRSNDEPVRAGLNSANIWQQLQSDAKAGPVFIKEFPHYIDHMADEDFLGHFRHSFLIRNPIKVLPSMYAHWPDFHIRETGFAEQRALFDRIAESLGTAPPVIDSDDLLNHPEKTVEAYCRALGIPFLAEALSWEAGERKEVSWYDKGSWHGKLRDSTGLKQQKRDYVPIDHNDHLKQSYELCQPHYETLYAHRLTVA